MASIQYHFGSHIFGRTTESPSFAARLQLLGKAKVHQLYISLFIQQQILWLQIPVDNVARVQIVKRLHNASCIESSGGIIEVALITQYRPEFATQAALHQHIQILLVFEGLEQFHNELAIGLAHYFLLGHDVLLLTRLNNLRLLHLFEGKRTRTVAIRLHQFHASKSTHTQCSNHAQIC